MITESRIPLTNTESYPPYVNQGLTSTDDPDKDSSNFLEDWGIDWKSANWKEDSSIIGESWHQVMAFPSPIVGRVQLHYGVPYATPIIYTDELSYKTESSYHVLLSKVPDDTIRLEGIHQANWLQRPYGLSNDFIQDVNLKFDFLSDFIPKAKKHARQTRQAYAHRIKALQEDGIFEGITINRASERDFWSFAKSTPLSPKASLVLMDSGNLRAVWKDDNDSHLGIQFLGNRQVQYVIFKRRLATTSVSRVAGIDTLEGVKIQIHAFDLTSFVNA